MRYMYTPDIIHTPHIHTCHYAAAAGAAVAPPILTAAAAAAAFAGIAGAATEITVLVRLLLPH